MISTIYAQRPSRYQPISGDRDDLQIIFSGNVLSIGHYIVAHFVAEENIVRIYDSLYGNGEHGRVIQTEEWDILHRLYPGREVRFIEPATKQPDGCSCGVFAIAYESILIARASKGV